jgi:hypothetical protein
VPTFAQVTDVQPASADGQTHHWRRGLRGRWASLANETRPDRSLSSGRRHPGCGALPAAIRQARKGPSLGRGRQREGVERLAHVRAGTSCTCSIGGAEPTDSDPDLTPDTSCYSLALSYRSHFFIRACRASFFPSADRLCSSLHHRPIPRAATAPQTRGFGTRVASLAERRPSSTSSTSR